jgi:hypothetical protein
VVQCAPPRAGVALYVNFAEQPMARRLAASDYLA